MIARHIFEDFIRIAPPKSYCRGEEESRFFPIFTDAVAIREQEKEIQYRYCYEGSRFSFLINNSLKQKTQLNKQIKKMVERSES